MREARIEQIGSPREIYDRPATPFVYEFLGSANRLPPRARRAGRCRGRLPIRPTASASPTAAMLFVRPHDLAVEPADAPRGCPRRLLPR